MSRFIIVAFCILLCTHMTSLGQAATADSALQFAFQNQLRTFDHQALQAAFDRFYSAYHRRDTQSEAQSFSLAVEFRNQIEQALTDGHQKHLGQWPVTLHSKKAFNHSIWIYELSMPSLIQRDNHASNTVHFRVLVPKRKLDCDFQYPTTIMLHTLLNTFDEVDTFSSTLIQFGMNKIVVIPYLPHFGPRRSQSSPFLTSDLVEIRRNFAQALLDTNMIHQWLQSSIAEAQLQVSVDQKRISMVGLSLGAIVGGVYAGVMPPITGGYSLFAGGGDLAGIIENTIRIDPNDELLVPYFKDDFEVLRYRRELAAVDPIVWAHGLTRSHLQFFNTKEDEIMDYNFSILRMQNEFAMNNRIEQRYYEGPHRLRIENLFHKIKLLFDFFLPVVNLVSQGSHSHTCTFPPRNTSN